jgi:hypothetical protein
LMLILASESLIKLSVCMIENIMLNKVAANTKPFFLSWISWATVLSPNLPQALNADVWKAYGKSTKAGYKSTVSWHFSCTVYQLIVPRPFRK